MKRRCLCTGHNREPCRKYGERIARPLGETDSPWPMKSCTRMGCTLSPSGEYSGSICAAAAAMRAVATVAAADRSSFCQFSGE